MKEEIKSPIKGLFYTLYISLSEYLILHYNILRTKILLKADRVKMAIKNYKGLVNLSTILYLIIFILIWVIFISSMAFHENGLTKGKIIGYDSCKAEYSVNIFPGVE